MSKVVKLYDMIEVQKAIYGPHNLKILKVEPYAQYIKEIEKRITDGLILK